MTDEERRTQFEEALARNRRKWEKLQDAGVRYSFPIPDTSLKQLFMAQAAQHPDKIYIYADGAQYTYGECNREALRIANGMLALGLTQGDRVISYLSNSKEFVTLTQACFKTGIILVNSNPRSTSYEIAYRVKDCTPRAAFVDSCSRQAVLDALQPDPLSVEHIVACPALGPVGAADGVIPWEAFLSDDLTEPDVTVHSEDIAVLQYTGGTTGVLKGCCTTNRAYLAKALAQVEFFKPILSAEDRERYLVMIGLGFSHALGFVQGITNNLAFGGAMFLANSLEEILYAIEKYKPTVWPSVPLWMKMIASDPRYQKFDITSLKCITCGSAPLPVDVMRKVESVTGAVITEGYGMTETVNTITVNSFKGRRSGTVGIPNPNMEYLIVDQVDGERVVADGEDGEIICRGACVMKEYWHNPEETAVMLRDGWLYTGDVGCMDEAGRLIIRDRKKDLIITSGFNVFPRELEDVAIQVDGVADACAIGIPDERRGEVPAVFLQAASDAILDVSAVEDCCREKLSRYKVPKRYFVVGEIPKTKNRKPDRKRLREMYRRMTAGENGSASEKNA